MGRRQEGGEIHRHLDSRAKLTRVAKATTYMRTLCGEPHMEIRAIRNETDHETALARIQELWGAKPGTPEGEEFNVLVTLVDVYEGEKYPVEPLHPVEAITIRMDDLGLTRKDLEPCIGTRARVSEILNRKRALTLPMIRKLSDLLRLPADHLIGSYPLVESGSKRKSKERCAANALC